MARIDRLKEFINYLKVLLAIMLATNIGLIGWLASNFEGLSRFFTYLTIITIFAILALIIILNNKIIRDIKSLEDL